MRLKSLPLPAEGIARPNRSSVRYWTVMSGLIRPLLITFYSVSNKLRYRRILPEFLY
jgi:hypothetical protein